VGLANGNDLETPLSSMAKQKRVKKTPGSGEALLRGQVKTLLQKVEEEAVISKLTMEVISPFLQIANSPMSLLAPTPANTPQIPNLSGPNGDALALVSPPSCVIEEQLITRVSPRYLVLSSCSFCFQEMKLFLVFDMKFESEEKEEKN